MPAKSCDERLFLSVDRVFGANYLKGSFSPLSDTRIFQGFRDLNRKELIVENFHHKFILV